MASQGRRQMQLIDSHCHIQDASVIGDGGMYAMWQRAERPNPDDMIGYAAKQGIAGCICVGTTLTDSKVAVEFVQSRHGWWASVGIHPHEAENGGQELEGVRDLLVG